MKFREFRICGDGFVWFVVANEQKKRFLFVSLRPQPANGFVGHDLGGKSFDWTDGDSIADEVVRIFVVRQCVVLGGEPMLKAVIVRLWLPRQVEASVQVPFAYMGSVVAVFLK